MSITLDRPAGRDNEGGTPRRWTREEFHRAAALGLFGPGERLELVAGEIYQKLTQNPPHAIGIGKTARALETVFGAGFNIRQQLPIVLATDSEPEPDLLVVRGEPDDYVEHPTPADVLLLVEVSDSTLRFDQGRKAATYAEAGIADYWLLNLIDRRLEVHRKPIEDTEAPFGFRYQLVLLITEGETIASLAMPETQIAVADLLPRS
jgi:Uma2 family endonuclease